MIDGCIAGSFFTNTFWTSYTKHDCVCFSRKALFTLQRMHLSVNAISAKSFWQQKANNRTLFPADGFQCRYIAYNVYNWRPSDVIIRNSQLVFRIKFTAKRWKRARYLRFLQRVSIACYAERCISYDRFCPTVRPSDRLSDTRWYHAKTTPATIMRSSLQDSPMILVSSWLTSARNFKGNIGSEAAEWERGSKNVAKMGNF